MLRHLLAEMQSALNKSFDHSHAAMAELGHPQVLYFDYVESRVENAIAFQYCGHRFIGITIPLVERILDRCGNLVQSAEVTDLLNLPLSHQDLDSVRGGLFMTQLVFVAAHEFGHHFLGHISDGTELWNEVGNIGRVGSLESQAREIAADSCAVYLTLDFLIDSEQRGQILQLLGQAIQQNEADEKLLSIFLLSASAFFFVRSPTALDNSRIYTETHPPAAARMNGIIQTARTWCDKLRPGLSASTNQERLENTFAAAATDTGTWREQMKFLESPDGKEYYGRLIQTLQLHPPASPKTVEPD